MTNEAANNICFVLHDELEIQEKQSIGRKVNDTIYQ